MQIALIGVIGVGALGMAALDLYRASPRRRGWKPAGALALIAGGLWYLLCFTSIVFFDASFIAAPPEQLALGILLSLTFYGWKTWSRRK
ncbi:hypothetical protein [Actinomadura sediminis]